MKKSLLILFSLLLSMASNAKKKPNIIIILADDLGFSDLGCFGGEIQTPNLDSLAKDGLRMTQIYNCARCCPSRASLLTGLYPHQTGMGLMDGNFPDRPSGYSGFRDTGNVTIPEVLKNAGYFTAMAGKWHLGNQMNPIDRGFEEYYGLLGGFDSFWNQEVYVRLPQSRPLRKYDDGSFYATNAITDYAIDFVNEANNRQQPLFLYLAYNAPHFPLQAPKEMTDKYMDVYIKGWDEIRDERWKRIVSMSLLQGKPKLSTRGVVPGSYFVNDDDVYPLPAWNSLTSDQQKDLARRMAIYAAMVDIMDRNIGRLITTLKQNGQYENSFIMFMSDNGACAEWHEFGFDGHSGIKYHTHVGKELDSMGLQGTYHHYGTGWANVCNTPFTLYKHFAHEGGISTPCIIAWGNHIKNKGGINYEPAHFSDIMASCIDLADTFYPQTYNNRPIIPTEGKSILSTVKGGVTNDRYIYSEHEGNRMVRYGDWKLVSTHFNKDKWELYYIKNDRTEQHDLAALYPEKVKALETAYFKWADKSNVLYFPTLWNEYIDKGKKKMEQYNAK
jgi:arylsulfatase